MLHLLTSIALAAPGSAGSALDTTPTANDPVQAPSGIADADANDTRIINGTESTRESWPMTGALLLSGTFTTQGYTFDDTLMICSSTLIAPDVVMLAAHCLDRQALEQQLGGPVENREFHWSRKKDLTEYALDGIPVNLPRDTVNVVGKVMHEEFDIYQMLTTGLGLNPNHDIALLFLEEPVFDSPLGYLPVADTDETRMEVGEELHVVGWGMQVPTDPFSQTPPPPGSYGVKMEGVSYVAEKAPYEFKVGNIESDVRKCNGDSGGPSFKAVETDSSDPFRVVGVTSHSYDYTLCSVTGGVDTRVSFHLDWIDQKMREACADGTRVWCEIEGIIPPPAADGTLAWELPAEGEAEAKGCGCSNASGAGLVGWLGLAALAFARRR